MEKVVEFKQAPLEINFPRFFQVRTDADRKEDREPVMESRRGGGSRGAKGSERALAERFSQLRGTSSTCLFAHVYSRRQPPGASLILC